MRTGLSVSLVNKARYVMRFPMKESASHTEAAAEIVANSGNMVDPSVWRFGGELLT